MPQKIPSVWHWGRDSGLLPASVYLRHCLLAAEKAGIFFLFFFGLLPASVCLLHCLLAAEKASAIVC